MDGILLADLYAKLVDSDVLTGDKLAAMKSIHLPAAYLFPTKDFDGLNFLHPAQTQRRR